MLKNALNRCHATPMLSSRETTTSQTSEATILTKAMTLTRSGLAGNRFDRALETGCDQVGASTRPAAILAARMLRMQAPTIRTIASTK